MLVIASWKSLRINPVSSRPQKGYHINAPSKQWYLSRIWRSKTKITVRTIEQQAIVWERIKKDK